jgi:hypothetical protein
MTRLEEIIWDIRACLEGLTIQSKLYGEGLITQITGNNPNDLIVHIHFNTDNEKRFHKAYNIAIALKTKNIILPDYTLKLYNGFMELAQEELIKEKELEKQKKLEEEALKKAEAEEQERIKAEKKAAQAFEKTKKRMIEKFEATAQEISNNITYANEYYYSLGWLAKNLTSIYARMPDYLDASFTKYFGSEAPRKLENSKDKNCVWTYGFSGHVKNADNAPVTVQAIMNPNSKDLSATGATAFFWDLVANHGFQFGKTQSVELIRSYIPKDMMTDFDLGYNT